MRQPDGKPKAASGEGRPASGERRRSGPRKQKAFVERATAHGHSGYGSESVRPHLRDQLRLKALMQPSFSAADLRPKDVEKESPNPVPRVGANSLGE